VEIRSKELITYHIQLESQQTELLMVEMEMS
jgi:hypothetical protein